MFLIGLSMLLFSICSVVFCVIPLFLTGTLSKDIIAYLMPFFAVLFIIGAVGIALMAVGLHQNYPERPFKQPVCVHPHCGADFGQLGPDLYHLPHPADRRH